MMHIDCLVKLYIYIYVLDGNVLLLDFQLAVNIIMPKVT